MSYEQKIVSIYGKIEPFYRKKYAEVSPLALFSINFICGICFLA